MSDDIRDDQNEEGGDKLTPVTRRLLNAAEDIALAESPIIEYQHSLFCQVGLPRSPQDSRVFERKPSADPQGRWVSFQP
jgi:hypothetical protein